jgi:phage protein D
LRWQIQERAWIADSDRLRDLAFRAGLTPEVAAKGQEVLIRVKRVDATDAAIYLRLTYRL